MLSSLKRFWGSKYIKRMGTVDFYNINSTHSFYVGLLSKSLTYLLFKLI